MIEKLKELLKNSYAPYSKVKVSAIVITNDGTEYKGVNVENAALGATICAERSAMLSAISNGVKVNDFKALHLTSNIGRLLYPCGECRQVMNEVLNKDTPIHIHHEDEVVVMTVEELSPGFVGKESF